MSSIKNAASESGEPLDPTTISPIVSPEWLREHRADPAVLVIDVRPREAYDDGHIDGAHHLDLSANRLASSSRGAIDAWLVNLQRSIQGAGITAGQRVVFYEEFSGTMAAFGVWLLDAAGLGNGSMLDGGLLAWRRAGGEISTEPVTPSPAATIIQLDERVLATVDQIMADLASGSASGKRVDARADTEAAQGAIPGSVNVDWRHHLDERGAFRPLAELARIYESLGLDKGDRVASYCAGGIRAANTYVVLKALGYEHVQNYAPSWGEWRSRPDTPVE